MKPEDRGQKTEVRRQKSEDRYRKSECGRGKERRKSHRAERIVQRQMRENRCQKKDDSDLKSEIGNTVVMLEAWLCRGRCGEVERLKMVYKDY